MRDARCRNFSHLISSLIVFSVCRRHVWRVKSLGDTVGVAGALASVLVPTQSREAEILKLFLSALKQGKDGVM